MPTLPLPRLTIPLLLANILLLASGCVRIKPVVLDRKTQLEHQVLGTFQRLEKDLILLSSVRGDETVATLSADQRAFLEAAMSREFNRDDIERLKGEQRIGEAKNALLAVLGAAPTAPEQQQIEQLVAQENRDRDVIMRHVLRQNSSLTAKDMPLVREVFHRMNLETAQPGERVQQADGRWIVVEL